MIYFNDSVVVAWVRGGFIEIAVHDATKGAVLPRAANADRPVMIRDNACRSAQFVCDWLAVPGFLTKSIPSGIDGTHSLAGNYHHDIAARSAERGAGSVCDRQKWVEPPHGHAPVAEGISTQSDGRREPNVADLRSRFDTEHYLSTAQRYRRLARVRPSAADDELLTRIG